MCLSSTLVSCRYFWVRLGTGRGLWNILQGERVGNREAVLSLLFPSKNNGGVKYFWVCGRCGSVVSRVFSPATKSCLSRLVRRTIARAEKSSGISTDPLG